MSSGRVAVMVVSLVTGLVPSVVLARGSCPRSCVGEAASCERTQCAGLQGKARRACKDTCRGRAGCPAAIGTLAYVVSECRQDAAGLLLEDRQTLQIRRGNCDPVTVAEFVGAGPVSALLDECLLFGLGRLGVVSFINGVFQRLAVSPDGSGVVFEVTDEFAVVASSHPLPAEQKGIFFVRADGSGLRRLGPPSRERFGVALQFRVESPGVAFSPNGRTIALPDKGPGPDGEDSSQIVMLDLASGKRTQLTRFPAVPPAIGLDGVLLPGTCCPTFVDAVTVGFGWFAHHDDPDYTGFTVRTDGSGLRQIPAPVAVPGSRVVPTFSIAGGRLAATLLLLPGTPVNPMANATMIQELFLLDGKNLLQLTNFRRVDTNGGPTFVSADRRRVFFFASADPLGANASETCQLFSIDTLGADLRQLTHFGGQERSLSGCYATFPPSCLIDLVFQDPRTGTIVFYSSCDPFGTGIYGGQLFAVRPDGRRLRQLTHARGLAVHAGLGASVELPGPFATPVR